LGNGTPFKAGQSDFTLPSELAPNTLYLGGTWAIQDEYAENKTEASIGYEFKAKNVYMVASAPGGISAEIWQDGKLVETIQIEGEELYHLIENPDYGEHTLEIKIPKAGLKAFTFTFG